MASEPPLSRLGERSFDANQLITVRQAAEFFPRRAGKPLGDKAIRRRITAGIGGVRLRAVLDGREWFTCRRWVEEFQDEVTRLKLKEPMPRGGGYEAAAKILRERFGSRAKW